MAYDYQLLDITIDKGVLFATISNMEIVLGSDDPDAATAEKWGYLNRALPG